MGPLPPELERTRVALAELVRSGRFHAASPEGVGYAIVRAVQAGQIPNLTLRIRPDESNLSGPPNTTPY